ncbi:YifB family Mg chelatase-like AAA ATPase [Salinimonas sp. HHU 13199]|uniref:YifB family Mg chelatase-like AAA ATPase n=1 Tax=Salinimonas profundi TaxID=2729140 RepID=A0ABR8LNS3_9ALTE|nr:YifB family Mg chelatase-like AAA ATPase [Salinimonas profundi]MBD3585754.1 YifB family Mg chelatase-like AAA ATPase [Salinimonas profundi]
MGYAVVNTRAGEGIGAPSVQVEVHLANGLPAFHLVGMAETCVKEARDRVRSALINSGFEFPAKRITVNLAPATIPKHGGRYDLPIAVGILIAAGILPATCADNYEFIGELGLNGKIKAVRGLIPALLAARQSAAQIIFPAENRHEAALVSGIIRRAAPDLTGVFNHLNNTASLPAITDALSGAPDTAAPEWDDIIGQSQAKRALVIAAAAEHHILFVGPPGTGKSLLANRLLSLLPPLDIEQALQVASIASVKGMGIDATSLFSRPFRAPHHTSSAIALTGGGTHPMPGEISLAHLGVLFLDELPEFGRRALDVLREPLETGDICISRAQAQAVYPARFQLVAAMNPSPTGDIHDGRTSPDNILRYINRISGPFLDRIDLQVNVPRLDEYTLSQPGAGQTDSAQRAKAQVTVARERQRDRQGKLNSALHSAELTEACRLCAKDLAFLQQAARQLKLSMRVFHRTLKVARTIADLESSDSVKQHHISEALGYRALDTIISQLSSN